MSKAGIKSLGEFASAAAAANVPYSEIGDDIGRVKEGTMNIGAFETKYPTLFDGTFSNIGGRGGDKKESLKGKARRAYNQAKKSKKPQIKNMGKNIEKGYKKPPKTPPRPAQIGGKKGKGGTQQPQQAGGGGLTPRDYGAGSQFDEYERARNWAGNNIAPNLPFQAFDSDMQTRIDGWANMSQKSKDTIWRNY